MLLQADCTLESLGSFLKKCQNLADMGRKEGLGIGVFVIGFSSSTGFHYAARIEELMLWILRFMSLCTGFSCHVMYSVSFSQKLLYLRRKAGVILG